MSASPRCRGNALRPRQGAGRCPGNRMGFPARQNQKGGWHRKKDGGEETGDEGEESRGGETGDSGGGEENRGGETGDRGAGEESQGGETGGRGAGEESPGEGGRGAGEESPGEGAGAGEESPGEGAGEESPGEGAGAGKESPEEETGGAGEESPGEETGGAGEESPGEGDQTKDGRRRDHSRGTPKRQPRPRRVVAHQGHSSSLTELRDPGGPYRQRGQSAARHLPVWPSARLAAHFLDAADNGARSHSPSLLTLLADSGSGRDAGLTIARSSPL
ncbi:hypothetical protein NDU88_001482 [Pleurodeles waltl]|uniref:Uncharacterized protein n=1 Tax=Pleurodeles waltl TaxID=8319 RepID=A0AAV7V9V5_PLEWA|nr:hypothetical protein NDU88_001482 [Pleurodeles waltl]